MHSSPGDSASTQYVRPQHPHPASTKLLVARLWTHASTRALPSVKARPVATTVAVVLVVPASLASNAPKMGNVTLLRVRTTRTALLGVSVIWRAAYAFVHRNVQVRRAVMTAVEERVACVHWVPSVLRMGRASYWTVPRIVNVQSVAIASVVNAFALHRVLQANSVVVTGAVVNADNVRTEVLAHLPGHVLRSLQTAAAHSSVRWTA